MDTGFEPNIEDSANAIRQAWSLADVLSLFDSPFNDLIFRAQSVHRQHFDPNAIQLSQLKSIKTGGCPEDCAYCPQSQKYAEETGVKAEKLIGVETVLADAQAAKDAGATRYCMGAAWTRPKDRDLDTVAQMIEGVKAMGLETCVTLGMLEADQAARLKDAGLDYYNHNIDTSESYYREIISTRNFDERLDTLRHVRDAGINVCCGGIVGMGETRNDRAEMLLTLANLPEAPESVPVNLLVRAPGTPLSDALADTPGLDPFEFVRTIAIARIMMPESHVRLSAGRENMTDEIQALCFLAGANSIFYGEQLLTTPNPRTAHDKALFDRLGLYPE